MFTLDSTVPVEYSICDGTPTPTAAGCPTCSITRRTVASTPSRSVSASVSGVGDSSSWLTRAALTAPTAILVPPTSTPSTSGSELTE
jgi:hypothetical protein